MSESRTESGHRGEEGLMGREGERKERQHWVRGKLKKAKRGLIEEGFASVLGESINFKCYESIFTDVYSTFCSACSVLVCVFVQGLYLKSEWDVLQYVSP